MQIFTVHGRAFAHHHDEIPAFHAAYLVLAVLAAAMFNMGAFAMLIIAHMALDVVKYREHHGFSWSMTIEGTIRESLVDIALLFVGLVFAVYLHHSVGIASLSGILRAEVTVIRALGTVLPKLKILHHFLKIMSHLHHYMETVHPHIHRGFSSLDRYCFAFIGISIVLLAVAAPLMGVDYALIQDILAEELIPWQM